jgi:hypothetical protein
MDDTEDKLRRGCRLLARARQDADLLGPALLAIHGAYETQLRARLSARLDLTSEERLSVDERQVSGAPLLALAQRYGGLSRAELEWLRWANEQRRGLARGEPFAGDEAALLGYARFVEAECGLPGLLDGVLDDEQASASSAARRAPPAWAAWLRRAAPPLLALAALIGLGWYAYWTIDPPRLLGAVGLLPQPTVTPGPTATPLPPTPPPRRARIVRLAGGPGWLHAEPNFNSPTLPPRLREGDEVILLGRQQPDIDGNLWVYVSVGGYDGWSPANNLEPIP